MIPVTDQIALDEKEIQLDFVQASGPGGQNVNKVATAVQLRFDAVHSPSLTEDVRLRLLSLAKNRITTEGILIIEARQYRTQEQNREDAIKRLVALVGQASIEPKHRRKTRPTRAAQERRLMHKRQRSELKQRRRAARGGEE